MKRSQLAAHSIIFLIGVVLLILAVIVHGAAHDVAISLGTTLAGVPIVSALLVFFGGDPLDSLRNEVTNLRTLSSLISSAESMGVRQIFTSRSDIPAAYFLERLQNANARIYLLAYAMEFVCDHSRMLHVIGERAKVGSDVKLLLGDPKGFFIQKRDDEEASEGSIPSRIETSLIRARNEMPNEQADIIRLFDAPLYASIYVFDDEMIVCPALYGKRGATAPAFVLRSGGGIFEKYLTQFCTIWENSTTSGGPA